MKIKDLFIYPIKSTKGVRLQESGIKTSGMAWDRTIAIIDSNNRVITGREHPKLVLLSSELGANFVALKTIRATHTFPLPDGVEKLELKLFRNIFFGIPFGEDANAWISEYLGDDYRLVHLNDNRPILEKRGGKPGEFMGYADASPIHLINSKTLDELNSKLTRKVTAQNFRPNIVISGNIAYEEDAWSHIRIGKLEFRVQERTQRCIFTTIDPRTARVDTAMQPLTTIAKIRLKRGNRPTFGINLVPMNEGKIKIGDNITAFKK